MMRRIKRGGFNYDFIGRTKLWLTISLVVVVVSLGGLTIRKLNLGLEFTGGTSFQVESTRGVNERDFEDAVAGTKVESPVVQRVGSRGFLIQTEDLGLDEQREVSEVVAKTAGVEPREVNVTDVGAKWGRQISAKALRALIIFLLVVTAYISVRFEPKMAGASLIALAHDLIATAGIYALTGLKVTPATVIALLTILGYSLYDSVIIFDRVKERGAGISAAGRQTYSDMANESLNQVLVRSLNTSLMSLLPVGSLLIVGSYLLGAETLQELALALFVGIAVGTYSSIFVAVPLLVVWKEREPRWAKLRARVAARAAEPTAARVAARPDEPSVSAATVSAPGRPGGRPPKRRAKRKRRR